MATGEYQVAGVNLKHTDGNQHSQLQGGTLSVLVAGTIKSSRSLSHQKAHDGLLYSADFYSGSVGDNGTALFTFHAGGTMPHMVFDVAVAGNAHIAIYEGGTITGGTASVLFNHLRSNTDALAGTVTHMGARTGGTALPQMFIPGGSKNFAGGGSRRGENEWIGNINMAYILELVNVSGSDIECSIGVTVYEEDE